MAYIVVYLNIAKITWSYRNIKYHVQHKARRPSLLRMHNIPVDSVSQPFEIEFAYVFLCGNRGYAGDPGVLSSVVSVIRRSVRRSQIPHVSISPHRNLQWSTFSLRIWQVVYKCWGYSKKFCNTIPCHNML